MASCLRRFSWLGIIPAVFFVNLASSLSSGPLDKLIIQKLCSPEGPAEDINHFNCDKPDIMDEASGIMSTRTAIRSALGAVGSLIFGLWRDSSGHSKYLILIGELAEFVGAIMYLLAAWSWSLSPWVSIMVESLVAGFCGSGVFQMGADCNVMSNSKLEERTMRLQYFVAATLLSMLIGGSCGGLILTSVGFTWSYLIAIGFHTVAVILILFLVKDSKTDRSEKMNLCLRLKQVFKSKPNNAVLWIMLICSTFIVSVYSAEAILGYYYQHQAFHFTVLDNSIFGTYSFMIPVLGSIIVPTLFIQVFKWSDFTVGMIASALTTIAALANAFVKSKLGLYLIAPLYLMKFILNSVPPSIFSKCIKDNELGLYFGVINVGSIILPFGINYLFHYVLAKTSQTMPGAIYFITAASTFICFVCFGICRFLFVEPEKSEEEDIRECESGIVNS